MSDLVWLRNSKDAYSRLLLYFQLAPLDHHRLGLLLPLDLDVGWASWDATLGKLNVWYFDFCFEHVFLKFLSLASFAAVGSQSYFGALDDQLIVCRPQASTSILSPALLVVEQEVAA